MQEGSTPIWSNLHCEVELELTQGLLEETEEKLTKAVEFIRYLSKWPCYDCYVDDEAETFLKKHNLLEE